MKISMSEIQRESESRKRIQQEAKLWLNELYRMSKGELKEKQERAERLKPDDGAIDYSKDKIQNASTSSQEERLLNYSMAVAAVEKLKEKIGRAERERCEMIDKLADGYEREILYARHINFKNWNQIEKEKRISVSTAHRIYNRALEHIYPFIKEVNNAEP